MHPIKISNFTRDMAGQPFPAFRVTSPAEAKVLCSNLAQRLDLAADAPGLSVYLRLREASRVVGELVTEDFSSELAEIMKRIGVSTEGSCLLDWSQLESLDVMSLGDVVRYFEYIWYPSSDDLAIIHPDLRWVILVSHYGEIGLWGRP